MANSQFTIYSYSDLNAPTLNGINGSLLNVLDYCLITGSKWTKPFPNSSNLGCYTQPSGSQCTLFVNDASPNGTAGAKEAWLTGWESLTSLTGPCGTGSCQFPTPSQLLTSGHFVARKSNTADGVARPWIMYADAYTFYLFYQAGDTAQIYFSTFFGDVFSLRGTEDNPRCMLSGRTAENVTNGTTQDQNDIITTPLPYGYGAGTGPNIAMSRNMWGRYTSPWFTRLGAYDLIQTTYNAANVFGMYGCVPCPNPSDYTIYIRPCMIWECGVGYRGRYRGMYHIPSNYSNFSDGQIIQGTNEFAGKTFQIVSRGPNTGFWAIEISDTLETN